jgi:monoamine oxidase
MAENDVEVLVIGGGAAGIAAARRLHQAGVRCLIVEARARLGGRAWTVRHDSGAVLDLGCGWLHSADRNPWVKVAEEQGAAVDRSRPPWSRSSPEIGFSFADQDDFQQAMAAFSARVDRVAERDTDLPASAYLDPNSRWNGLINALGSYIAGAEWDRVSALDYYRYEDSGVNWRVLKGYGALIVDAAAGLPVRYDCAVHAIDHRGKRLRVDTDQGPIVADAAIVTVPSALLAAERVAFTPALPDKTEAAHGLPLGLADKLFIALKDADEFDKNIRIFGHTDRAATGAYQFRPLGQPFIEAYFGGSFAAELEAGGDGAFFDCAVSELVGLFGSAFAARLAPIGIHCWRADPLALGSYSYASPGHADERQVLAAPVDNRLFFAGEACSLGDYSTAHGAYRTGVAAAEQAVAARKSGV